MKLLFDQNLSPHLAMKLTTLFPGSKHVQDVGLDKASDDQVWMYASKNSFTIISKDADFSDRIEILGYPPKIIWIKKENCSTSAIESILRENYPYIKNFEQDRETGILSSENTYNPGSRKKIYETS